MHVGSSQYWAELGEWAATIGEGWAHKRNLQDEPLQVGECICRRSDCVAGLYGTFKQHLLREEEGSVGAAMEIGQTSPMGRYPSTGPQVRLICAPLERMSCTYPARCPVVMIDHGTLMKQSL